MNRPFQAAMRGTLSLLLMNGCAWAFADQAIADATVREPGIEAIATGVVGQQVPGLAVLVVQDGELVHRAAYGSREIGDAARPVDLHTPFYVASVAKMLTAAAVLSLIEDGRIGLDAPVSSLLSEVPAYASEVTVRQLLTHTSGVPDYYEIGGEGRSYTTDQVIDLLDNAGALQFAPGTRAGYSNSGYVLLAMLVESVSGVSYADFVQQRLFEPTGMNNAYVVTEPGALPVGRAVGYIADHASGWRRAEYDSAVPGPGGVYLSLADLEAWYRALADGRILKADSLALAARPPELPGNRRTPYGMGWLAEFAARGPLKDRWYVLAYGSLGGYRAAWQWYREDDLMIAWLANGNDDELLGAFHGVAERLLGTPPVTP